MRVFSAQMLLRSSSALFCMGVQGAAYLPLADQLHIAPVSSGQRRLCSTKVDDVSGKWKSTSIVSITSFNLEKELLRSHVPTLLVFYSDMHPASKNYVSTVKDLIIKRNEKAKSVQLRVATVSCDNEMALARQFQADRLGLPLTYLLYKGQMLDRLTGDLAAATIETALDTFLKVVAERFGGGEKEKTNADDEKSDETNPFFHVNEAKKMLETPGTDLQLAEAALDNAEKQCQEPIESFKKSIGFGQKRITPEMTNKMRENLHIKSLARVLGVRIAIAFRKGDGKAALENAKRIRADFPWVLKDDLALAKDVVRVEISEIADYDSVKHDQAYFDENLSSSEYDVKLREACRHYFIGEHEECINVLLGLIKTDVQFKKTSATTSKAQSMILKVFEALGAESDLVRKTRKTLARYLFC